MKIGFITFDLVEGKADNASSRIRAKWPVKYWPEAEIYKYGQKYDAIIFEKAYLLEQAKLFDGIKILDICDADWIHNHRVVEMIQEVDAITCPTESLAEFFKGITDKPVVVIPDRVDLQYFKKKKKHKGVAKECVWYGYAHNHEPLKYVLPFLDKLGLNLSVISDKPIPLKLRKGKVRFTRWDSKTVNDEIIKSDIALCPIGSNQIWKYKSNNRTVNAWALNMPVANCYEDLVRFMSSEARQTECKEKLELVEFAYDVRSSVAQYKQLIKELQ